MTRLTAQTQQYRQRQRTQQFQKSRPSITIAYPGKGYLANIESAVRSFGQPQIVVRDQTGRMVGL